MQKQRQKERELKRKALKKNVWFIVIFFIAVILSGI
jgi:hypothetical protein